MAASSNPFLARLTAILDLHKDFDSDTLVAPLEYTPRMDRILQSLNRITSRPDFSKEVPGSAKGPISSSAADQLNMNILDKETAKVREVISHGDFTRRIDLPPVRILS